MKQILSVVLSILLLSPSGVLAAKRSLQPSEAFIKIKKNNNEAVFGAKRKVKLEAEVLVNDAEDPKLICGSGNTIVSGEGAEAINFVFEDNFRPGGTIRASLGEEAAILIIDKITMILNKEGIELAKVTFQEDKADQEVLGEEGEELLSNDVSEAVGSIEFACPNEGQANFIGGGSIGGFNLKPGQGVSFIRGFAIPTEIIFQGNGSGWGGSGSVANVNGLSVCGFGMGPNITRTCRVSPGNFQIQVKSFSPSINAAQGEIRFFN